MPWWIFSGFFQKILEGSVDHILRRDSVVTQNSFISSSLATRPAEEGSSLGIIFRSKETRQSVSWLISEVSQTWNLFLFFLFFFFSPPFFFFFFLNSVKKKIIRNVFVPISCDRVVSFCLVLVQCLV